MWLLALAVCNLASGIVIFFAENCKEYLETNFVPLLKRPTIIHSCGKKSECTKNICVVLFAKECSNEKEMCELKTNINKYSNRI